MRIGLREFVFFLVLLAVPVASFMYLFKPRNEKIQQIGTEVEIKQERLDKLEQVAAKIDDLELAIERGRDSIRTIEEKLPSRKEEDNILEQVWRLAENNGLRVQSFRPDVQVAAAKYMELPLHIVMEGQFDGFYEFLLELETLKRITRIHAMNLARIAETSDNKDRSRPGAMRAEFTLSIYFESDGNEAEEPVA